MQIRRVATFDPINIRAYDDRQMFPAAPPMEIEAISINTIKITIGGITRLVDGISLCNAVNQSIGDWRKANRR